MTLAAHTADPLALDVLIVAAAGAATMLATGLGAIPVFALGTRAAALQPFLRGTTIGVMATASIVGLLLPALEDDGPGSAAVGFAAGTLFLLLARAAIERRPVPAARVLANPSQERSRREAALVFLVLLVHSLPEGFAIGAAYASGTEGLGLFVIVGIALQNVPEGTATALPMEAAGMSKPRQFWTAVLSSAPQPLGAVVAVVLVEEIRALLPLSLAFAAGAMLALVVVELVPQALARGGRAHAGLGTAAGCAAMLALSAWLGV